MALTREPGDVADAGGGDRGLDLGALRAVAGDDEAQSRACLAQPARDGDGAHQVDLVLDRLQATDGADDDVFRAEGRVDKIDAAALPRARGGATNRGRRHEARGIDAVTDALDALQRDAHALDQIGLDVPGQRDVAADEGTVGAPQPLELAPRAARIGDVPAMLAMHARGHASGPGRHHRLERGEIAGVHDGRAMRAEQAVELRVEPGAMAGRLVQRDEADVLAPDAAAEGLGAVGERHHGVAEALGRQMVDQVAHAVLQAADIEAVHDVHHQRAPIRHQDTWVATGSTGAAPDATRPALAASALPGGASSSQSSMRRCADQL